MSNTLTRDIHALFHRPKKSGGKPVTIYAPSWLNYERYISFKLDSSRNFSAARRDPETRTILEALH